MLNNKNIVTEKINTRFELINFIIDQMKYNSYLEIGINKGICFNKVSCDKKVGVDPNPKLESPSKYPIYTVTSDEYFKNVIGKDENFDLIFIDGLHHHEQIEKDIINSLSKLSKTGMIVMHDCNPPAERQARENFNDFGNFWTWEMTLRPGSTLGLEKWNGTAWKTFSKFRCKRDDIFMMTVDIDWGCGILIPQLDQVRFTDMSYEECCKFENFKKNSKKILNLYSKKAINNISSPHGRQGFINLLQKIKSLTEMKERQCIHLNYKLIKE